MVEQNPQDESRKPSLCLHSIPDVLSWPDPKWLIDGILTEGSLAVLFGPPEIGKSFLALGWAFAIAAAKPWHDREVNGGSVVYIAAEGRGGLKQRIRALQAHEGYSADHPLWFVDEPVNFMESGDVKASIEALEARAGNPALVVVDTLARCFVGGDENSAKDVGQFVHGVATVQRETGATGLVIHHTGKDERRGARGSSALLAAADTMIEATVGDLDLLFIQCVKQKDAEPFGKFTVKRRTVDLGDGRSSCVVVPFDMGLASESPQDNAKAKMMLAKLGEKFGAEGATHGEWKRACIDDLGISESTFNRQIKELQEKGLVVKQGDGQGARYRLAKSETEPVSVSG